MKLAIIKNDEISDKDESINNASNNISTSSLNQMDDVNTEKSKPITRMVLSGVQQGNIEVFGKRHKHVWKPSVENGYKNTDLLGTVAVGGWNDNEEEGESARNNASNIVLHTGKKQERVRKIVLQQMSKAERDRKRNHYLDRWDSKLDEGKRKKLKGSKTEFKVDNISPLANPFQQIQNSMRKMHAGWKVSKKKVQRKNAEIQ